jgi:AcrR family transcriptional regulator
MLYGVESAARSPAFSRLDPEGRRRQILEAARRVFAKQPYPQVSIQDVAAEAGVTRALVHHYFGGKPQLFREVVASLAPEALALIESDPATPIEELVARNTTAWLDFLDEHRELALELAAGGRHSDDPELAAIDERSREQIVDQVILNHTGTLEVAPQVRFLVRSYFALVEGVAREWLSRERATREEAQVLLERSLLALMRDVLPELVRVGNGALRQPPSGFRRGRA